VGCMGGHFWRIEGFAVLVVCVGYVGERSGELVVGDSKGQRNHNKGFDVCIRLRLRQCYVRMTNAVVSLNEAIFPLKIVVRKFGVSWFKKLWRNT
jgi:hypothetical protein